LGLSIRTPPPILLLAGPTASGKSSLALRLAEMICGEIINADSMQVYADLRVLTARPSIEDETRAPHHLYGVTDAAKAWSVGRWLAAARRALDEIAARRRPAIVVGGTGLYFRALTQGLAEIPAIAPEVRERTLSDFDAHGEAAFRAQLSKVDPQAEARIASGDRQRLTRALEVFEATGKSLSDWQANTPPTLAPDSWRGIVLTPPRPQLYERIDARLAQMSRNGALDEVARLIARGLDPHLPAMKALGVEAFAAQLTGATSPQMALAQAQMETRRYAKRQTTWFEHQAPTWERIDPAGRLLRELTP
jgi:tRNA dimethylallyltransferase